MSNEGNVASQEKRSQLTIALVICLNIVSVVSVVVVNKKLFSEAVGFAFPNCLMAFHMATTCAGMYLLRCAGLFTPLDKHPPIRDVATIAFWQVGSVMFVNYSLLYNTVGQYQVLKLANIPTICVMEYYWKGITYSRRVTLALVLLCCGIGLSTVSDLSINRLGCTFGAMAAVTTGAMHIGVKSASDVMNPMQHCYYVSRFTCLFFCFIAFGCGEFIDIAHYTFTRTTLTLLASSGVCAFMINLSVFLIVGQTSPVTYQVVGHVKTLLVFGAGWLFFAVCECSTG